MVLTVSVTHIFQFPIDQAVKAYFKNQDLFRKLDGELKSTTETAHIYNEEDGLSCTKTNLIYENFIPKLIRKIPKLEEPEFMFEEECWMDLAEQHYWIRYRNNIWNDSVSVLRTLAFTPESQNPKWTRFECDGAVEFHNWGWVGQGIEVFMRNRMEKTILQCIQLLTEKLGDLQQDKEIADR